MIADRLAPIELVVFDKDGTLIDFHGMWGGWAFGLADALEAATGLALRGPLLDRLGVGRTGRARAHGTLAATPMGRIRESTVELVRGLGLGSAEAESAVARAWAPPDPVGLAKPLTDLRALLGFLRAGGPSPMGRRIAIATTDDRAPTVRTIDALGLGDLVDDAVCADDGVPLKPAPDMVLHLCAALGVSPARTAVVGDSPSDLRMGRAAGAGLVVGVLSGVGRRPELAPLADIIVPSVAALAS